MGKKIKDGFGFMEYVNGGLIRRIDDIPRLKHELIALGETKTHLELSRYALLLAEHILEVSGTERCGAIGECFAVVARWQEGQAHFQAGRDVADALHRLAREEQDPVRTKVLRPWDRWRQRPMSGGTHWPPRNMPWSSPTFSTQAIWSRCGKSASGRLGP